jgi:hypothetical protein
MSDQLCFVSACLLTGRLIYYKACPGDCPTQTKIDLGASAKASKVVKLGATAGSALGLLGISIPLGPIALAAIPVAIWAAISAHHKIAVAREQATLCDVSQAYDQWEQTVEAGIVSGQLTASDVKNFLPQVEQQLLQACQAIVKGGCNAACYFQKAIKALDLYAVEKLYDSLSPQAQMLNNPANPAQPANPSQIANAKSPLTTYGIAGAGAYAAVKLIGALV